VRLAGSKTPDRYESVCVTTGRPSYAGQVKGDDPAEKGNLGSTGSGLVVRQTNSYCKNLFVDSASKMPQMGLKKKEVSFEGGQCKEGLIAPCPFAILVAGP
jgi:hypothetical protein